MLIGISLIRANQKMKEQDELEGNGILFFLEIYHHII
jgi:hypothetical protein